MLWELLRELGRRFEDISINALAGLYVSLIWALAVWAYFHRRDRRNLRLLQNAFQYPAPSEIGCGQDLFVVGLTNPADKPITITGVTLSLADGSHTIRVVDPDKLIQLRKSGANVAAAYTTEPVPVTIPLRWHGREFIPIQPEPDVICADLPRVALYPGEIHRWWATHLKDPNDLWFPRMLVRDLIVEVQYEGLNQKPMLATVHANKACLRHIQGLIESNRKKVEQSSGG